MNIFPGNPAKFRKTMVTGKRLQKIVYPAFFSHFGSDSGSSSSKITPCSASLVNRRTAV